MAEQPSSSPDINPTAMLESILSNPELLKSIGGLLGASSKSDVPEKSNGGQDTDGLAGVLANPELMSKLPQIMAMLKPMLSASAPSENPSAASENASETAALPVAIAPKAPSPSCRDDLLLALKPFLSAGRCEAVDTIIRLSRLGAVLKHLR